MKEGEGRRGSRKSPKRNLEDGDVKRPDAPQAARGIEETQRGQNPQTLTGKTETPHEPPPRPSKKQLSQLTFQSQFGAGLDRRTDRATATSGATVRPAPFFSISPVAPLAESDSCFFEGIFEGASTNQTREILFQWLFYQRLAGSLEGIVLRQVQLGRF